MCSVNDTPENRNRQRVLILTLASGIGLRDDERRDIFEYVTGVAGGSIKRMNGAQLEKCIDSLRGYQAVLTTIAARPNVRAMLAARGAI